MENVTVAMIQGWPLDDCGWHVSPDGVHIKLGDNVSIGAYVSIRDNVSIGAYASIGDNASIRDNVSIGNNARIRAYACIGDNASIRDNASIGNNVSIGNNASIGADARIGADASIGADARIGDNVSIGANARIGAGITSLKLAEQFRNALRLSCETFRAVKWVTPERMSPNFDGGTPIHYAPGAVIEIDGNADDQQCAAGLHVLRWGYRPEWVGLCEPEHDLIPLAVEVKTDRVLFAGLPGNDAKLRVGWLRVLEEPYPPELAEGKEQGDADKT